VNVELSAFHEGSGAEKIDPPGGHDLVNKKKIVKEKRKVTEEEKLPELPDGARVPSLPDAQEQKAKCHENDTETDICAVVYGAVPAKNCRQPVSRVESPSYGSYDAGETSDFFLQVASPLFVEHSFFIACVPLVTFCYFFASTGCLLREEDYQ
jgi:hypothetical protein